MSSEVRAVSSLALLYVIRMLGLFMVLPVLMLSGSQYTGSSPTSLGLALGIYGLTQAVFQVPLGYLSDVLGRKPVIALGLIIFMIGSVIAAYSESVTGLIFGRALQGSGAIASAIMALVADLTREESRTKAMAAIGASIGLSFTLAIILGPVISAYGGIDAIFTVSAGLALLGIFILVFIVPTPAGRSEAANQRKVVPALLWGSLANPTLLRLDFGIFCLHAVLMGVFVAIPSMISSSLGLSADKHWWVYLSVLLSSFIFMVPIMMLAERKKKAQLVFVLAIVSLAVSLLTMYFSHVIAAIFVMALFVFFTAFNYLEASLPSQVSKEAPEASKGTALGVYSTAQFLGAFVGGVGGGWLFGAFGAPSVFLVSAGLVVLWFGMTCLGLRSLNEPIAKDRSTNKAEDDLESQVL